MAITKQTVADKIAAYLRHDMSLADLVSWAEDAMMEGEFDESEAATISEVVSRLGVTDVRAFGLTWEDCRAVWQDMLGYDANLRAEDDIGMNDKSRMTLFILPSVRRLFATGRQNLPLSDSSLMVRAARETLLMF